MTGRAIALAALILSACASQPTTVVWRTYHGTTPQGESVTRFIDPLFFRDKANADAYMARNRIRNQKIDPGGSFSFDVGPIEFAD